jgi:hypothetical protein
MIDMSLAGLIGAIAGTLVAAITYHAFIGALDRSLRKPAPSQTAEERSAAEFRLSMVRRAVLAVDLFIFAALGYWLGRMFET